MIQSRPSRPTPRTLLALVALVAATSLLSGCFALKSGRNYAVGAESNRMNVVVHTVATKFLYDKGRNDGVASSRNLLLSVAPTKISISARDRLLICGISVALCLSADQIGRTIASWFKSDVRNRGDYWEALTDAGSSGRCFAWTFVPSRNLTHKGRGTSGCTKGYLV